MDGELSKGTASRVEQHLRDCWHCRSSLSELERQTQRVVHAFNSSIHFGHSSGIQATGELLRRARELEARLPTSAQTMPLLRRLALRRSVVPFAVAAACVLIATVILLQRADRQELSARDVISSARQIESQELGTPLRQELQVSIERSGARAVTRRGRLQIWSDLRQSRYAARWSDNSGLLRQAMWTQNGQQLVYRPAGGQRLRAGAAAHATVAELADDVWSTEDAEQAFLDWLERRDWRPLLLGEDFGLLTSRQGYVMRVERGSGNSLQVSAWHTASGRQVRALLVLDADTRRPRLQRIELTHGERRVAISLAVTRHDRLETGGMPPIVFDGRSSESGIRTEVRVPELRTETLTHDKPETGVDALYALHRVRACLGEAVEVSTERGKVAVRGLVESAARRAVILEALAGINPDLAARAQIRTVDEVVAEGHGRVPDSRLGQDGPQVIESPASRVEAEVRKGLGLNNAAMTRFAADMLESATELLDHAWALRRLGAAHASSSLEDLPVHARWLLETMHADHVRAMREHALVLWEKLAPAVTALAPPGTVPATALNTDEPVAASLPGLVSDAETVRRHAEVLLGAAPEGQVTPAGAAMELRRSLRHLQGRLSAFEDKARRAAGAAADREERNAR